MKPKAKNAPYLITVRFIQLFRYYSLYNRTVQTAVPEAAIFATALFLFLQNLEFWKSLY